MTIKSRGPTSIHTGGRYWVGGAVESGPVTWYGKQWTNSVNTPGPPYTMRNNFVTEKLTGKPGRQTSTTSWGPDWVVGWYRDCAVTYQIGQNSHPEISHWPFPVPSIEDKWFTQALARVNFTKPVVSLPNFIFELREFPRMLQDLGRVLDGGSRTSDIPGAHLAWQFGWGPLLSDIKTMLALGLELEKQRKRFLKAQSTKTLQGSILEDESTFQEAVSNYNLGVTGHRRTWTRKDDVWYTAHWDLGLGPKPPELFGDAWQVGINAFGLNRPAAAIWQAIPWSFIVDYFTNISVFLEASGGIAEYRPSEVCIMYTCEAKLSGENVTFDSDTVGSYAPGEYKIVRKMRGVQSHPVPRPYFDTWGFEDKLTILSSLVTANAIRGARS